MRQVSTVTLTVEEPEKTPSLETWEPSVEKSNNLGRYRILSCLGTGGMGVVYEAWDALTGATVAVKRLQGLNPKGTYLLKQEFRTAASVAHPNVAGFLELAIDAQGGIFALVLVRGEPWSLFVSRGGEATLRQALWGLVAGVQALHRAGVYHLDLKPSNVLVETGGRVVLVDFGLSRFADAPADPLRPRALTPGYASPELWQNQNLNAATDWYSVGAMLFEALTGVLPPPGVDAPRPSALASGIPDDLDTLCAGLLSTYAGDRPSEEEIVRLLTQSDAPLPRVPPRPEMRTFVGREAEFAQLQQWMAQWQSGRMAWGLVQGAGGIGKTALIQQLINRFSGTQTLVLRGRCREREVVPFNVIDGVMDDLASYLAGMRPSEHASLVAAVAAAASIFPILRTFAQPLAQTDQAAAFTAIRRLLFVIAQFRPVCIVVDDVHWGDADSARLLSFLLEGTPPPVLWLFSARPTKEEAPLIELLQRLADGAQILNLQALPAAAAHTLARQRLGPLAAESAVERLVSEAAGVPVLVEELADAAVGPGMTPTLSDVVEARLSRLSPDVRALAELVSLSGRPAPQWALSSKVGISEPLKALTSLAYAHMVRFRWLRASATVEPWHDRIGEAVIASLEPSLRQRHHETLAQIFEAIQPIEPEVVAIHWLGAGQLAKVAPYAMAAAEKARQAFAFDQAVYWLEMAQQWSGWTVAQRRDLEVQRAVALSAASRPTAAAQAWQKLALQQETELRDHYLHAAAQEYLTSGQVDTGMVLLEPMLVRYGVRLSSNSIGMVFYLIGALFRLRFGEAWKKSMPVEAALLCWTAAQGLLITDFLRGACYAIEALLRARASQNTVAIAQTSLSVGAVLGPMPGALGRWGLQMMAEGERYTEALDLAYLRGIVEVNKGQFALMAGRWPECLERSLRGERLLCQERLGVRYALNVSRMGLLRAAEECGRLDLLQDYAEVWMQEASARQDRYAELTFAFSVATVWALRGQPERGLEALRHAFSSWEAMSFQLQHFYAARSEIYLLLQLGRVGEAQACLAQLWPRLRRSPVLQVPIGRMDAYVLRVRVLLAAAEGEGSPKLLAQARQDILQLSNSGRLDAQAYAMLFSACATRIAKGDPEQQLREAAVLALASGLGVLGACAQYLGSDDAMPLQKMGILDTEMWLRAYAPGARRKAR